jgi:hypothetical protein
MKALYCIEGKLMMRRIVKSLLFSSFILSKCHINAQVYNKISLEGSPYNVLEVNIDQYHYILYNSLETIEVKMGRYKN